MIDPINSTISIRSLIPAPYSLLQRFGQFQVDGRGCADGDVRYINATPAGREAIPAAGVPHLPPPHSRGMIHPPIMLRLPASPLSVLARGRAKPHLFPVRYKYGASFSHRSSEQTAVMASLARPEEEEHIFRGRAVKVPDGMTLPEFVLEGAEQYADKVALVEHATGKEYTYGEVARDVGRLGKALRSLGLRRGDVVVVVLPNIALYPVVTLGIMASGGVFSGANPLAIPAEISKQVRDSGAKLLVTDAQFYPKVAELGLPVIIAGGERVGGECTVMYWDELLEAADRAGAAGREAAAVQATDLCALPYSSGTTGGSKGVMLSHHNLVANLCSTLDGVDQEMVGHTVTLGLMPFFHIYGITGICCAALRNKGKVVVLTRFQVAEFMEVLARYEVNFAPIVPPIMLAMVKSPAMADFDVSRLKLKAVMTAAAPFSPELRSEFEAKFPGVQIQEARFTVVHISRIFPDAWMDGSGVRDDGAQLHHADAQQRGDGARGGKEELGGVRDSEPGSQIRGPRHGAFPPPEHPRRTLRSEPMRHARFPRTSKLARWFSPLRLSILGMAAGYHNNREETERTVDAQGWLHTGDIGYIDEDGDVFIVDRIKELIKYKGFQVAPAELEDVLFSHPAVQDAAVFPLPDEEAGEIPAACVVLAAGAEETEEKLMGYVAANVASYKRIRSLHLVDAIPRSASGKIMRRLLRDELIQKLGQKKSE